MLVSSGLQSTSRLGAVGGAPSSRAAGSPGSGQAWLLYAGHVVVRDSVEASERSRERNVDRAKNRMVGTIQARNGLSKVKCAVLVMLS